MGNFLSGVPTDKCALTSNDNTESESETMEDVKCLHDNDERPPEEKFYDVESDYEESRAKIKEEEMNEFRKQLNVKREQRKQILARHKTEKKELENNLYYEKKAKIELCEKNRLLRELLMKNNIDIPNELQGDNEKMYIVDSISHMEQEIEKLKSTNISLRCDLTKSNSALQAAYSDLAEMSAQNSTAIKQVHALKEVITVSKTMISLREEQLNELKMKLNEIEQSLADRETNMLSTDLRQEYERQLQNIRTLRSLYEERARLADVSRQALTRELDEHKVLLDVEINKNKDITAKVNELETKVNVLEDTVEDKNNLISTCQEETRGVKAEMSVVNKLFSQVLLGYKNKQDLDKLIHRLEENHGILTQMAEKENGSEVSSELPKLLLEIVSQIEESNTTCESTPIDCEVKSDTQNTTAEEIVENLPKVWRVLIELLSHQRETEAPTSDKVTTCYKSVETKSGPVLVPSVSQTYIRLKDLILEKLTLIKEVNRMKQLNTHLESRLEEQEKRLCNVTNELSKTWNVVGRLRRHHHQLHTHEKILKYELQQKRKLLNELKEELEYCREKWEQAREKNSQSEKDWKKLRIEFSNRKLKPELMSINNSAESGYSDERQSDESSESNDESEYVELKVKCKKKIKKSFETNSSADYNLAAEREDPASDMLDVADLPLDTQDENHECDVSDSYNSESLLNNVKLHVETEDEAADMAIDSCMEDNSITDRSPDRSLADRNVDVSTHDSTHKKSFHEKFSIAPESSAPSIHVEIDPATIIKNIREQTERLIKKDKRLEKLENDGANLLTKTQSITKFSEQINSALDIILTRPTSSVQVEHERNNIELHENRESNKISKGDVNIDESIEFIIKSDHQLPQPNYDLLNQEDESPANMCTYSLSVTENSTDHDNERSIEILENVTHPNECVQLQGECLENIEKECSDTADIISDGLNSDMFAQLDTLNESNNKEINQLQLLHCNKNGDLKSENNNQTNLDEPSTSREIDHEARFAARDLRLKRLEEQTKSLVNKVNRTTTKGVRIHYKLEELHNIYGSENSRSGTPSEDTEDISQNDDDVSNEQN